MWVSSGRPRRLLCLTRQASQRHLDSLGVWIVPCVPSRRLPGGSTPQASRAQIRRGELGDLVALAGWQDRASQACIKHDRCPAGVPLMAGVSLRREPMPAGSAPPAPTSKVHMLVFIRPAGKTDYRHVSEYQDTLTMNGDCGDRPGGSVKTAPGFHRGCAGRSRLRSRPLGGSTADPACEIHQPGCASSYLHRSKPVKIPHGVALSRASRWEEPYGDVDR